MVAQPSPSSDPNIGRVLIDRYEIIELLGKGAMGKVYLARHVLLGGAVAVKFLIHPLINDKMRDRFYTEARTCALLGQKSIHIVRVTDFGEAEHGVPFYVMEYLKGDSLSAVIQKQPLSLPRFLNLSRHICLGLKAAHEGIVIDDALCPIIHRDIKPSNILVSPDDSLGEIARVLDFGIAKLKSVDANVTTDFKGTIAYASPEQMEGKDLDHRSDIYSLGIMMFQMLTGKLPIFSEVQGFGGWYKAHTSQRPLTFEKVAPKLQIPSEIKDLIYSCLAKKPAQRPSQVSDIIDTFAPLEQKFSQGLQLGYQIKAKLLKVPVVDRPSIDGTPVITPPARPLTLDELCYLQSWPTDKPRRSIVFPQVLVTQQHRLATLWAMLPKDVIDQMTFSQLYLRRYYTLLCTLSPYPMVMWVVGLYSKLFPRQVDPRWFKCFLDLKNAQGQELMHLLGETQEFRVLFFTLEDPSRCAYVLRLGLKAQLVSQLQQWLIMGRSAASGGTGSSMMSRELLTGEYEKLKLRVNEELMNQG